MIDTTLPLTDIHRHLDGNIRPQTILELGRQYNISLPAQSLETLIPHVQVIANEPDLVSFLTKLDWGALGVGKLRYPFLNLTWAVSTLCLLNYNQNFLQGVLTEYSLAFILAVLISFSVCLLYMVRIFSAASRVGESSTSNNFNTPLSASCSESLKQIMIAERRS